MLFSPFLNIYNPRKKMMLRWYYWATLHELRHQNKGRVIFS